MDALDADEGEQSVFTARPRRRHRYDAYDMEEMEEALVMGNKYYHSVSAVGS